jgi:hypothetical protein
MNLEAARTRYVADLQRVYLRFDEQMSDVEVLLRSLLGEEAPFGATALDTTRTIYLEHVRARCHGIDEQLLELAKACTHLFEPVLGLTSAA